MSSERVSELPDNLREWVEHHAAETDREPSDVLTQAITAYQLLEDGAGVEENGSDVAPIRLPEDTDLSERLDSMDERLSDVETDVEEKIQDVRERVIQVKQETDAKAGADHDHPKLHQRLQRALQTAEEATEKNEQLSQRVAQVDQGFENFEEILEYLTDTTDELEEKLDALAYTVINLRKRIGKLEGTASAHAAADELKAAANREGITAAKCGGCESKVQLGLLSTPHCPHCGTTFRKVEPSDGLFGSAYLRTGDRPALEGGESDTPDTPQDLFEEYDTSEDQQ
jgi:DNA repair exonuclease SbcCD ATPase subunit